MPQWFERYVAENDKGVVKRIYHIVTQLVKDHREREKLLSGITVQEEFYLLDVIGYDANISESELLPPLLSEHHWSIGGVHNDVEKKSLCVVIYKQRDAAAPGRNDALSLDVPATAFSANGVIVDPRQLCVRGRDIANIEIINREFPELTTPLINMVHAFQLRDFTNCQFIKVAIVKHISESILVVMSNFTNKVDLISAGRCKEARDCVVRDVLFNPKHCSITVSITNPRATQQAVAVVAK